MAAPQKPLGIQAPSNHSYCHPKSVLLILMFQGGNQSSIHHIYIPGRKLEDGKKFTLFDVQFIEFFQTQAVV